MEDLETRVRRVIAEAQKIDIETVRPEASFEELGIDSFDGVNLLFAVETEFDIAVSDADAKELRTIQDVIDGVAKLTAAKPDDGDAPDNAVATAD